MVQSWQVVVQALAVSALPDAGCVVQQIVRVVVRKTVHPRRLFTFVFLSLPRLHPSSNEKALLLRSVRWHTIQAHAEKGLAGLLVAMPVAA